MIFYLFIYMSTFRVNRLYDNCSNESSFHQGPLKTLHRPLWKPHGETIFISSILKEGWIYLAFMAHLTLAVDCRETDVKPYQCNMLGFYEIRFSFCIFNVWLKSEFLSILFLCCPLLCSGSTWVKLKYVFSACSYIHMQIYQQVEREFLSKGWHLCFFYTSDIL